MEISRIKTIFALFAVAIALGACAGNQAGNINSNASNANQPANTKIEIIERDDLEDLARIIKLPFTPLDATYSEVDTDDQNAAPNDQKFVAVLRFTTEDAAKIVAGAEKYKPPAPSDIDAETWFPPELIAKSQETGDEFLKGVQYAANDFIQPPYLNGKLTRLNDTDYFVLELTAF